MSSRHRPSINPGHSGGPLLDEYSRLVGVNTFVPRVSEEGLPLEGLNDSLRRSLALGWINRQGTVQVNAVSRASVPVVVAEPGPRAGSGSESGSELETVPPSKATRAVLPPPAEPEAREFKGPDGESMYGVPNPTIDLHDALPHARKGYQALIDRADESVDEMNRLLDDYGNFLGA